MLSAIAARKAAAAAKNAEISKLDQDQSTFQENGTLDSESETEALKKVLQPKKRKPKLETVESSPSTRPKKRRKQKGLKDSKSIRYFQEAQQEVKDDVLETQNDVVLVESSGDEEDSDSGSENVDDGSSRSQAMDIMVGVVGGPVIESSPRKRAWSPSQPFIDSSEDEDAPVDEHYGHGTETVPQQQLRQERTYATLSTFTPKADINLFFLDAAEVILLSGGRIDASGTSKSTLVTLSPGEKMGLVGTYSMCILRGSISMAGVDMAPSHNAHPIFAPRCSPIPIITASDRLCSPLRGLDLVSVERLRVLQESENILLLFRSLYTGVEELGDVCRTFEDVFKPVEASDILQLSSAHMVRVQSAYEQPFELPKSWNDVLLSVTPPKTDAGEEVFEKTSQLQCPIILVKGSKKVGKSTLARTLLNRLITKYRRVAFIECDIGQTEFTPPGIISLNILDQVIFGPPFTHPKIPYQAHFIGSISPKGSPSNYLKSFESLLLSYRSEIQYSTTYAKEHDDDRIDDVVPLVVNTMGWNKGLGADLTRRIEEILEPTHVLNFREPVTRGRSSGYERTPYNIQHGLKTEMGMDIDSSTVVLEVDPIPENPLSLRYTASDWRAISLVSYFHTRLPLPSSLLAFPGDHPMSFSTIAKTSLSWNATLPLVSVRPYVVEPDVAFDSIVLVGAGTEDVVEDEIGRVLNGAVVAFVRCQPGIIDLQEGNKKMVLKYQQGASPPDPFTSSCVGIGVIRAVSPSLISPDDDNKEPLNIQVLTPIPPVFLSLTRCIVKGEIELPVWCMLDHREFDSKRSNKEQEKNTPFLQWSKAEGFGADRRRVRRNILRRGQM